MPRFSTLHHDFVRFRSLHHKLPQPVDVTLGFAHRSFKGDVFKDDVASTQSVD